jgi:hypothetical protein
VDDGDSNDANMEMEGNGALDIYDDAHVMTYLQIGEVLIRLLPKEKDDIVHKTKRFKWEGNSLLHVWEDGRVKVVPRL